jgi:hypothetical protein
VWPDINGVQNGPFILDTGASGLVITPQAASRLDMEQFGRLWVSGVGGSVECQYRRAVSLRLGPISIERCVDYILLRELCFLALAAFVATLLLSNLYGCPFVLP